MVLILSLFGAMLAARLTEKRPTLIVSGYALAIQGAMTAAFIGLILSVSNPFLRLNAPPIDGQGLNPVLQDPALAFHPQCFIWAMWDYRLVLHSRSQH